MKTTYFHYVTYALILIGALNWGLIGFFEFDLVATLFGEMSVLSRIVYSLVGVSALLEILFILKGEKIEKKMAH